jgi:F-type H+-transporting ATPase subunit a
MLSSIFAQTGPVIHITPGGVMTIDGVSITNSILYGWISTLVIIIFLLFVARKVSVKPKRGLIQLVEVGVEFIVNLVEGAFDDIEVAKKTAPYFVTIFFFILLNNWLGLLPFVGEGFTSNGYPLLRPFTADLSATVAMGVITMGFVYYGSIKYSGGFKQYMGHFFVGSPRNPLYLIIGMLEMFTDITRVISLSLRLFLNVTIGEIVIAVFAYLGHVIAPVTALPFTLIEIFIAALQAYIFTILATMYLAVAVNHAQQHNADHLTEGEDPETMGQLSVGEIS